MVDQLNIHEKIITHLNRDYTEPIRDPLWSNIYLSPPLKELTRKKPFQDLGRIMQLGPTFHVYPGATHTRLNHSLGVFHLSKRIITRMLMHPDCPTLSLEGVKSFLAASLLHDLGHFPYTHSLKELPLKEHELLAGEAILESPMKDCLTKDLGVDPGMVAAIIDEGMKAPDSETRFYRRILSGVLDPDKLDYMNRDAYFCGVPYGIQDTDFVISKMVPHKGSIALDYQGIPAVENILFSKYLMYRTVYWHKVVRIATAMIKKAIYFGLQEDCIQPEDLYGLTDQDLSTIYGKKIFPYSRLVRGVANRDLYKMVYEVDFDGTNRNHMSILGLEARFQKEQEIAALLSTKRKKITGEDIIIDIPEQISFSIDMPVIQNGKEIPFAQSPSVFTPPVVNSFTRSLRKIRLVVNSDIADSFKKPEELLGWKV
ncbi:MAG: HD domain-containing protein [Spirochaetales bacterium]|nr:HD domain-containing protein [Spirochaetales bacterium]